MNWTLDAEHPLGKALRIRRFVWPSGLRLVLLSDRAAPILSFQTWFRVGSSHERVGATGMAHFFEHLMFGETALFPMGEFDRLIEESGGDNNAATWTDWTFYRTSLPACELDLAARLESDRMRNLTLSDEHLETERDVVINERKERVEDDIDGFLDERLNALAFREHPYRWPTIGWMEDIRSLHKRDVQAFYDRFYAPDNATLVLVGDVEEDRVLDVIARYYGDIPASGLPEVKLPEEPEQAGERREHHERPVAAERLLCAYKAPGQGHPDWAVLEFIAALLGGTPSARLYRRLVVDLELASSVDASMNPFRDPSLLRFAVNLSRGHTADQAIDELDTVLAELLTRPVTEAELHKVRNLVETDFWISMEDCDGKAETLGHYESTLGDFRRLFDMADRLARVSAADIQRVAATYLRPERRTIVSATPSGELSS